MQALQTGRSPALRGAPHRRNAGIVRKTWSRVDAVRVQAAESTVPVDFSIKCKVDYGESVRLVGNQAFLGNWKPNKAIEMRWTEGNIWKAEARVAVGTEVEFKVVKMKPDGEATWEEGDNRTFKILGPEYGLNVSSAWAKPQDTKIDAFKLSDGSKQPHASASSNGVGAAAQQAQQQQQQQGGGGGGSKGSGRSREASATSSATSSMDAGDSSSRGANTALLSKSSFEEESCSRGAWVGADPEFVRSRKKDERPAGVWRTEGLSGVALALVQGDEQASSWLKKLGLQKKLLVDEPPACRPRLADLAFLYVYATWINTGALPCAESGSHYRPNHHANLALAMFRSLEWVIGDATRGGGGRNPAAEKLILAARRMHTRLPSFSGEFRVSTPLTRIRDIAHRNDIPKPLKDEIKHTLQNKLHRSAGPEDLVATEVMLQRITAKPGEYSEAFVEEFKIFTRELREFFNASGLVELLQGTLPALDDAHGSAVRQLLQLKDRVEAAGGGGNGNGASGGAKLDDLMALLTATTQARSFYSAGLVAGLRNDVTDEVLAMRQRWRLADIRLEEYAFVVLSRIIGQLEEQGAPAKLPKATNLQWALPLAALTSGLRHMGLSLYDTRELLVLENELQRWHSTSPLTETRDAALRAKATLERALRVATEYSDALTDVYGQPAAALGRALGLPEHMGAIFAEAEVRASMAFQVSKLASMLARALRTAAGQEPWDVLVPGEVCGVLRESASLDSDALGPASSSSSNGNGNGGDDGVVLMVRRADGDEELGPLGPRLRAVVLLQELPHLSHLGVRARQDRVPFMTCDDADVINRVLRPLLGRRVTLTATGDCAVNLREGGSAAAATSAAGAAKQPAAKAATPAAGSAAPDAAAITAVGTAYAAGKWGEVVVPLDKAATATCGSKSAKCGALVALAAASGGLFAAPRGAVLPFGCLEAAVAAAGRDTEARFKELLGQLEDGGKTSDGAALDAACAQLQALVAGLAVPPALVQQVVKSLTGGKAAAEQQLLLAVRSSANVEDLAGMSAAGLYDSVVGVAAADDGAVGAAVAAVWASLYTRRAVLSRRSAGVPQSSARMAVLVMEMVAPDLSFVLHTARPRDGNDKVLLAEVAPGQGETLASGVRGTPWRFEVEKASGKVDTLAYANFSTALMLPVQGTAAAVPAFAAYGSGAATSLIEGSSSGGHAAPRPHVPTALVDREVDYSTQRMSADKDWRVATVQKLAAVGGSIEKAMGGVPQDIEGGVVLGQDGSMALHVFQTRPQ
ncbi:hypothetical protein HYH02_005363 [Chlamydomonas schloesseri]|uniref:CBM20 domain-containing protein n=1 Tax=Chlamydomonas schloesseri TaxID=2026947 RepID=A0A836B7J3_9CHLO|nr:hypothetical protein HYH02_005363 [Chlamydomonas schloesseri]|eukprot:KAG2449840.1 hypothetical protein HYH02_005363 [Chlamydomonas schloesseri]